MKEHIDIFESIRQQIEFRSTEPMPAKDINVAFLISLRDSETWKNYRNTNLHRTVTMRTVDLISEVSPIDDSSWTTVSSSTPSFAGMDAQAMTTSMSYQSWSQHGGFRGSYRGNYHGSRGGNHNRSGRHLRPPFNPNAYGRGCKEHGHSVEDCPTKCNYCKERSHLIYNCFKLKWVNEQRFSRWDDNGEHIDGTMDIQYYPSFQRSGWMYIFLRGGFLVSMLCRESHITIRGIYKRFFLPRHVFMYLEFSLSKNPGNVGII